MSACISCEIELPRGAKQCPACGTDQAVLAAKSDEARCSVHRDVQAIGTCQRCGRFACVKCTSVDAGVCRDCVGVLEHEARARSETLMVRAGWVAVVQGISAAAITWGRGDLFWLLAAVGSLSVVFGLVSVVKRQQSVIGMLASMLIGFISLFAIFHTPLLVVCLALTFLEWRFIKQSEPIDRELWHLK